MRLHPLATKRQWMPESQRNRSDMVPQGRRLGARRARNHRFIEVRLTTVPLDNLQMASRLPHKGLVQPPGRHTMPPLRVQRRRLIRQALHRSCHALKPQSRQREHRRMATADQKQAVQKVALKHFLARRTRSQGRQEDERIWVLPHQEEAGAPEESRKRNKHCLKDLARWTLSRLTTTK